MEPNLYEKRLLVVLLLETNNAEENSLIHCSMQLVESKLCWSGSRFISVSLEDQLIISWIVCNTSVRAQFPLIQVGEQFKKWLHLIILLPHSWIIPLSTTLMAKLKISGCLLFPAGLIDFQQDLMTDETEEWELSATGAHCHIYAHFVCYSLLYSSFWKVPLVLVPSCLFLGKSTLSSSNRSVAYWFFKLRLIFWGTTQGEHGDVEVSYGI